MRGRAVQFGHIPKQCRTAAVMRVPLSCDHCAVQADQHWSVQVGGWTDQNLMLLASCMLLALI